MSIVVRFSPIDLTAEKYDATTQQARGSGARVSA